MEQRAVGAVMVAESAEGELAGRMIACSAGQRAAGVLLARALAATVEVEEDDRITRINQLLRYAELVKTVRLRRVTKLPEDRFDLGVSGAVFGDERDGARIVMEDLKGGRPDDGARWVLRRCRRGRRCGCCI